MYFVYEKSQWACDQYPPEGEVVFYNIRVEYDYKQVVPKWTTAKVDDACDNTAHILNE